MIRAQSFCDTERRVVMRKAGKATLDKLEVLGSQLAEKMQQKKIIDTEIAELRKQIAELASNFELPIVDGASQYANVPSGYVRVTRPAAPTPKLLTRKLLDIMVQHLGEGDGRSTFLDVLVLPKTCEVDVERWNSLVKDEVVRDRWLVDALEDDKEPPRPVVVFELGKRKEIDT
jgi:hypothetical protein